MANKDFMDPELTEEEKRETILANEDDYLEGLLAAADNAANDTKKIEIIRNERKYFSFSIHSLTDEMLKDIRKKYTKYTKNRRQGIRVADELDMPKYRASVIYNSTTEMMAVYSAAKETNILRYNSARTVLSTITGVSDFIDFTMDGKRENIHLSSSEYADTGNVTFTLEGAET